MEVMCPAQTWLCYRVTNMAFPENITQKTGYKWPGWQRRNSQTCNYVSLLLSLYVYVSECLPSVNLTQVRCPLCLQLVFEALPPVQHSAFLWACFALSRANKPASEQVCKLVRQEGTMCRLCLQSVLKTSLPTWILSFTNIMEQFLLTYNIGPFCTFSLNGYA